MALIMGFIAFIYKFSEFRTSDKAYLEFLGEAGYEEYGIDRVQRGDDMMRYVWAGEAGKPILLMIHGSPSSSSFWKGFFMDSLLRKEFRLVAVDRPGYGYSNFGKLNPDLTDQAELVHDALLKLVTDEEVFTLASSYGGPVAARLAMIHPDMVDGVIFQSSSLIPKEERTYAFTHWTKGAFLSKLLPVTIRLANEEKLSHASELEKIQGDWDKITAHTVFLHGSEDALVYPENATRAHALVENAQSKELIFFQGRGHDLYWTRRTELRQAILGIKQKYLTYLSGNSE